MKLVKSITQQTFFDVLQQAQLLVFSTLGNILVINLISREEYGLIGLSAGYFSIFSWLLISPEGILVQKYQEYKSDFSKHISIFYTFNIIKIIFSLFVLLLISLIFFYLQKSWHFSLIFLLFSLSQMLIMFLGQIQYFLKIKFQQKKITSFTTVLRTAQTIILFFLYLKPSVLFYLIFLSFFTILEIFIYSRILQKVHNFLWWYPLKETLQVIVKNIKEFSFWNHMTSMLIKYIYEIDVVFLSFWASLTVVGNYSIALKIANLSFILPSLIQNSTTLALTRIIISEKRNIAVNIFVKYAFILSSLQLIGFMLFGKLYIEFHTHAYVDEIYLYSLLIMIGTTILNSFRPILSYIISSSEIKKFFNFSVLPSVIFATLIYLILGKLFLAVGLAAANILAYAFWVSTMFVFSYKKLGLRFKFSILEFSEKEFLRAILNKENKP